MSGHATSAPAERDLDALLEVARRAAAAGGEVVRGAFGRAARDVSAKGPGDYVSAADMTSEHAARQVLEEGAPGVPVFGEEEGGSRGRLGWLVDPLDGTANFLHDFPVVGVSVGLVEDGIPIVGVVDAPLLGQTWWATAGGGAFHDGRAVRISDRSPATAICATGFPFRGKAERFDQYLPVFERVFRSVEDLRRAGAACLDLAWTASGIFDGFFELKLGPWDVAAGALMVREAGGVVTDWKGDERAWLDSGDIVAGPPQVHEHLLRCIEASTWGAP